MLTAAQQVILAADITPLLEAGQEFENVPHTTDGCFAIADAYNVGASPDWWVWKTDLTQRDIVSESSVDATTWNWTTYIARSAAERDGWREMFADTGSINPSKPNVRQGLGDIFSGADQESVDQRTHLLAMGRKLATRAEKLLSTGTGSTGSPATMGFEGNLSYQDVKLAMGW